MKMNVALTADELMNVVDAAMNEAIDRGFDDEDKDFAEDMLAVVDAALSAMGIEIIEDEEEFFDDDEYEEDEEDEEEEEEASFEDLIYEYNGKRVVSKESADFILATLMSFVLSDDRIADDDKWDTGVKIFIKFCEDHGIEGVDVSE